MITPSATAPTSAACSGVPMPKPDRDRHRRVGLGRRDQVGERRRQLVALAGGPGVGDQVDEALGLGADPRPALGRASSARPAGSARARRRAAPRRPRRPPRAAGRGRSRRRRRRRRARRANRSGPAGEDHVRVGHRHHRHPRRRSARRSASTESSVAPASSARVAGGVDHRAVGERVGVRDPELDQVGAGVGVGVGDRGRGPASGKPPIMYGISAARPSVLRGGERGGDAAQPSPRRSTTSARSLSPRPESVKTS